MKISCNKRGLAVAALLWCTVAFAQFTYINGPSVSLSPRTALIKDNSGRYWLNAGSNGGVAVLSGSTWTIYNTSNGSPFNRYKHLLEAGNEIWMASRDSGVAVYNNVSWTVYNTANSGLAGDTINDMCSDGNTVWLATSRGLSQFNGSTWNSYTTANSALFSNAIIQVSANNGIVWIVTAAGVNMFDTATQSWAGWNTAALPPIGTLTCILSQGNNVWLGGTTGSAYYNNGNFRSIKEITDNVNFSAKGIEPGVLGMPIFHGYSWNAPAVQLRQNAVPERIQIPSSSALTVKYDPAAGEYYYTTATGDISALSGTQVIGKGNNPQQIYSGLDFSNNRYLNVNDVNTSFMSRGDFGWNLSIAQFEVPKGSGKHCLFTSGLWVGGLDAGGQLHQAGMTYRQKGIDYFPGPLDTTTAATDSLIAYQYDYIWKINRSDIEAFIYHFAQGNVQNGSFIPSRDIISWPAHGTGNYSRNLAPFVDVNGNGIYDPLAGGDYPKIKGDQMLYWIFNDNLAPHTETGGQPLGIEVHASAWAYACPALPDSEQVLNTTLFYSFELINRSSITYSDVYAGLFQDYDLGDYADDFIGSAPADNTAFVYNGNANDGGVVQPQPGKYGANPPVFGLTVLDGPLADLMDATDNDNDGVIDEAGEKSLLTHFMYYGNDFSIIGNPDSASDYYNYLRAHWLDGTPLTYGGNGYGGTTSATHIFPGIPFDTTQWNEFSVNNTPFDRRGISSTFINTLAPDTSVTITYAQIWSRDSTAVHGTPGYINFFLNDVRRVQNWYAAGNFPSCVTWTVGTGNNPQQLPDAKLYPNPGNELVTLDYLPKTDNAILEIIDITGRTVQREQLRMQQLNVFNVNELQPGIYLLRMADGANTVTFRFVRQ